MVDKEKIFLIIILISVIVFGIMHFIFYFFFKITNFNDTYDSFESYPLFNFKISKNTCETNENEEYIIFHELQDIEETATKEELKYKNKIMKINENYFCYEKQKSYRELLYSGQIIKQNENCKQGYKNCGIIDTLNQKLCVLINNECPLYDVGINGDNENYDSNPDYIYDYNSKIYYNNNNYEAENKKIIGKLILNEGQPCYNSKEKLWRSFGSKEAKENHLKCELEILGKYSDNRYEKKGNISYYDLYKDNFNYQFFILLDENELKKEKVSLYKREFLGIDKECDEKSDISHKDYSLLKKNQKFEKTLLLVEPIITFFFMFIAILCLCKNYKDIYCLYLIYFLLLIPCMICHCVFIKKIIKNDLFYECSDEITNEILNQENKNTKKTIIYTAINLTADVLINIQLLIFLILVCKEESCFCTHQEKPPKIENLPNKHQGINENINKNFYNIILNRIDTNNEIPRKNNINENNKDQKLNDNIIAHTNEVNDLKLGIKNKEKINHITDRASQNSDSKL